MQPAAPTRTFTQPHSDSLNEQLPEVARRQLDALRNALDVRLARLEDVLADPTRGESLETLILDLARVASEEAQATASLACIDVRRSADAELARVRSASQTAVDTERAAVSELRRSVEQAKQRIAALEHEKQTELRVLREQFEALLTRERTKVVTTEKKAQDTKQLLEQTKQETQRQLERVKQEAQGQIEHTTQEAHRQGEQTKQEAHRQVEQTKQEAQRQLEQTKQEAQRQLEQVKHDVQRELEQTRQDVQRQLEQAKQAAQRQLDQMKHAAAADLKKATDKSAELKTALEAAHARAGAVQEEWTAKLAQAEQASAQTAQAAAKAHAQLETERGVVADLRQELESSRTLAGEVRQQLETERAATADLRQQLESATASIANVQHEHQQAVAWSDELQAELARVEDRLKNAEEAVSSTRSALEAEREEAEALRRSLADANERSTSVAREHALSQAASQTVEEELAHVREEIAANQRERVDREAEYQRERAALEAAYERERADLEASLRRERADLTGDHQQAREDLEARLEAERAAGDKMRELMKRAQAVLTTLEHHNKALHTRYQDVASELDRSREGAIESERARADTQAMLETERALNGELRDLLDRSTPAAAAGDEELASGSDVDDGFEDAPADPSALPGASADGASWNAVRLANRYAFNEPLEVLINGEAGRLFDLSVAGCQLVSPARLKPNHAIRVLLPGDTPLLCLGKVVWVNMELPASGRSLGYRAGVKFAKPDVEAIEAFIIANTNSL